MKKIQIRPSPTADSRTAQGPVTKEQLLESSKQHIQDVQLAMDIFRELLFQASLRHDRTKITMIDQFHDNFVSFTPGAGFKQGNWFHRHVTEERHHLNDHCPKDVNLIDVLERVADIVMAGLGRSGEIHEDKLDPQILVDAYWNTVKLLADHVEVVQHDETPPEPV